MPPRPHDENRAMVGRQTERFSNSHKKIKMVSDKSKFGLQISFTFFYTSRFGSIWQLDGNITFIKHRGSGPNMVRQAQIK